MTNDKLAFLRILKDYLNMEKSTLPDDINRSVLHEYAAKHNLVGVLYHQTGDVNLRGEYCSTIFKYLKRQKALKEIEVELDKTGMQHFTVKGMIISEFYQKPQLRTMGDCDIVVHDKAAAARHLQTCGFEIQSEDIKEIHLIRDNMEFEFHDIMLHEEKFNEVALQEFFNDCWPYVHNNRLNDSFHFLFSIVHLRKHFLYEGVGFRLFMDVAVFSRQALNWEWIIEKLEELCLMTFTRKCFALIERWFGITCPIGAADISEEFYEKATDITFENGLFGGGYRSMIARVAEEQKRKNKALMVVSRFFPSYHELRKKGDRYRFLDGRPWLLPFTWVYRWCVSWRKGGERLGEVYKYDEETRNRRQYLEEWDAE